MNPREKILAANDRKLTPLFVPEWDETVYIPGNFSLADSEKLLASPDGESNSSRLARHFTIICRTVDASAMFSDADIPALMEKDRNVIIRIVDQFNKLHGSDAEKNSETTPA